MNSPIIHIACKSLLLLAATVAVAGCATVPFEKRAIWCNEPLKYSHGVHFDKRHLDVARDRYIYVLALFSPLETLGGSRSQ